MTTATAVTYYLVEARERGGPWTLWSEVGSSAEGEMEICAARRDYPSYQFRTRKVSR